MLRAVLASLVFIFVAAPARAQKADPFKAFRYYEGTWRVKAIPGSHTEPTLHEYEVTEKCADKNSVLWCIDHFIPIDPKDPIPDQQFQITKDPRNPTIFYERILGSSLSWRVEAKPWGSRFEMHLNPYAYPENDSNCAQTSKTRVLNQTEYNDHHILGTNLYETISYSMTLVVPACTPDDARPARVGKVTRVFYRQK